MGYLASGYPTKASGEAGLTSRVALPCLTRRPIRFARLASDHQRLLWSY